MLALYKNYTCFFDLGAHMPHLTHYLLTVAMFCQTGCQMLLDTQFDGDQGGESVAGAMAGAVVQDVELDHGLDLSLIHI